MYEMRKAVWCCRVVTEFSNSRWEGKSNDICTDFIFKYFLVYFVTLNIKFRPCCGLRAKQQTYETWPAPIANIRHVDIDIIAVYPTSYQFDR